MKSDLNRFRSEFDEIWLVDTEFSQPRGELPLLLCVVCHELFSGRWVHRWSDHEDVLTPTPLPTAPRMLLVAYLASAELNAFRSVNWQQPGHILDLHAEFRCLTSGTHVAGGHGLLGALAYFGLPASESGDKQAMRQLAIRGGPYTVEEKKGLLAYCQTDVKAIHGLFLAMLPGLDLPCALFRGRYMHSVAAMEWRGIPLDKAVLGSLRDRWPELQSHLIQTVDREFGVYDGATFKAARWEAWVATNQIDWPRLPTGKLQLDDDTFKEVGRRHPAVARMRQLRLTVSQLRSQDLPVGADGRNRTMLSPYASKTGRNQPSTTAFIFGPAVWMRSLIKPEPGMALAYLDYEQQEFGIAAALSKDVNMMGAYTSGDPYLDFARKAGAVPASATKESDPHERDLFKGCALGVQYGMGEATMALRLGITHVEARELLDLHCQVFRRYWKWSDAVQDFAMLHGYLEAVFGWKVHVCSGANPRSLRNFPLQANGAEMLRLACCLAHERGVRLCAPVHDALLIEAPIEEIGEAVERCAGAMREASAVVLEGFGLRVDSNVIRYPDRYRDPRGAAMWKMVTGFLGIDDHEPVVEYDTNLSCSQTDVPCPLCLSI